MTRNSVGARADRVFDRLRHPDAFTIGRSEAPTGDLRPLNGFSYALLVTYGRSGPVPTPVWFALDEAGAVYIKTREDSGKIKRVRRHPEVLLAGSSARGRPRTAPIRGVGRVLERDEWEPAETALAAAYGLGRRVSEALLGEEDAAAYLEIRARET